MDDKIEAPDAEALLFKINSGKSVEQSDIDAIVQLLELLAVSTDQAETSVDDLYAYLLVIARLKDHSYRHLLERYLDYKDPFTVSMVLETLCLDWNLGQEYLERVISFAVGVSWDEEDDLRISGLKILGELAGKLNSEESKENSGRTEQRRELLSLLLGIFDDQELEDWTRIAAYKALLRGANRPPEELPSDCALLDLSETSEELNWEVINHARKLTGAEAQSAISSSDNSEDS